MDLLVEQGTNILAVEAKSGATVPTEAFAPLDAVAGLLPEVRERVILHGGADSWLHKGAWAVSYRNIDSIDWGAGTVKRARAPERAPLEPRELTVARGEAAPERRGEGNKGLTQGREASRLTRSDDGMLS